VVARDATGGKALAAKLAEWAGHTPDKQIAEYRHL
jgi:hypothetical protein